MKRTGGWWYFCCEARKKEKVDDRSINSGSDARDQRGLLGGSDGDRRGGGGGSSANRFAAAVFLIVCVQLIVNYLAMRSFVVGSGKSGDGSDGTGEMIRDYSLRSIPARLNAEMHVSTSAAPSNAFEANYYPPGVFLGHGDGRADNLPVPRATERYTSIDFQPQEPEETAAGTNGRLTTEKMTQRWRPKHEGDKHKPRSHVKFPPVPVDANAFAASFKGRFHFEAGQHRFVMASSGGFRLFVDGVVLIDELSHASSSKREPFVGTRLINIPVSGTREILLEFEQPPAVVSRAHWKAFASTPTLPPLDWEQAAEIMLGAHLHLHWMKDDFGLKIYMYDLPVRFNDDVRDSNEKCKKGHMFGSEVAVHLSLAESSVRTLDPREADLFYMPVYTACKYLGAPYFGVDPWFGKRMTKQAIKYAKQEFPFWRRHNGADHVFAMTYDYGACFEYKFSKANAKGVLRELNNAILLSIISDASVSCFRPAIDVPIPTYIEPTSKLLAPLPQPTMLSSASTSTSIMISEQRDWFTYFQGQKEWVIDHDPEYSNGIRNELFTQYADDPLFHLGLGKTPQYVENLRRSVFCLCPRGFAVWSPRLYESIVSGCIPVIIADNIHLPFSFKGSGVDWRDFSIMVPESRVRKGQLKSILLSLSSEAILAKQQALRRVRNKMVFLPPQQQNVRAVASGSTGGTKLAVVEVPVHPRGDAFEMVLLALREKVRAAKWVRSTLASGFWT